jgi:hypothetical protein
MISTTSKLGRNKLFAIYQVESKEQITEETRPVVGFGIKKAKAILNQYEELKQWVEEQEAKDD